jgi:hypothetical protein
MQKNIGRFHIAVNNALFAGIIQCFGYCFADFNGGLDGNLSLLPDALVQSHALQLFHGHLMHRSGLSYVM